MELDHIFIVVDPAAGAEAALLNEFGLAEGAQNVHPGQGTSNRRFFFRNAFLELLYVSNMEEVQSALTRSIDLDKRLTERGNNVSPFGVCFRPSNALQELEPISPSRRYNPQYLPKHLTINVGEAPLSEPMWFYLPFATRPDEASLEKMQPMLHPVGVNEMSKVRIGIPVEECYSDCAAKAIASGGIELFFADEQLIDLEFDGQAKGKSKDFRPFLPLIIRW